MKRNYCFTGLVLFVAIFGLLTFSASGYVLDVMEVMCVDTDPIEDALLEMARIL